MLTQPAITFRNIASSKAIERKVEEKLVGLEKHFPRLESAEVVIARPLKRRVSGTGFEVRIKLTVPGMDQHAKKYIEHGETSENIDLALNAAFDAARRRLDEHAERLTPHLSGHHARIEHGHIDRIFEGEGYGFIRAEEDGEEYYFSREALTSAFWEKLRVDTRVRFHAEDGENGLFASNVSLMDN